MRYLSAKGVDEGLGLIRTRLQAGESVIVSARGMSMWPFYRNGANVLIEPCSIDDVEKGDVVLVLVASQLLLHRVVGRLGRGIITKGDARRRPDGVVPPERLLGRAPRRRSDVILGQMSGVMGTPLWIIANIYRQFFDRIQGRP